MALVTLQARTTGEFVRSVGVNTHLDFVWSSYRDLAGVTAALSYLGVDNVRDAITGPASVGRFQALHRDLGVMFDFFIAPGSTTVAWQLEQIRGAAAITRAVEGPNESDIYPRSYAGLTGLPAAAAIQRDVYTFVHGSAALAGVPVIQSSFARAASFDAFGNLAAFADYANTHTYFGTGNPPASGVERLVDLAQQVSPGDPTITTEAGYYTIAGDRHGVSEAVQAKYDLTLLVDQFQAGVSQTYLYELFDQQPGSAVPNNNFGLFRTDGTPKPAATAVCNLLRLLADVPGAEAGAPGALAFSLGAVPGTVSSLLLQQSDGDFVLVLWNDVRLSGPVVQADIAVAPVPVTLRLLDAHAAIEVFDPLLGTAAVARFDATSQAAIAVPDHPILIEISAATVEGRGTPAIAAPAVTRVGPNVAPVGRQTVTTLSTTAVAGVAVEDEAAATNPGQMIATVRARIGTVSLVPVAGGTVRGSDSASVSVSGTLAQINAALGALRYTAPGVVGGDTLTVSTYDQFGLSATRMIGVSILEPAQRAQPDADPLALVVAEPVPLAPAPPTPVPPAPVSWAPIPPALEAETRAPVPVIAAPSEPVVVRNVPLIGFTDRFGASGAVALEAVEAAGPGFLQWQYIYAGAEGIALSTEAANVFIRSGSGSDAIQVSTGQNVLDGGAGSNFLTGGPGADTFFTDARDAGVVWNTIRDFGAGDAATLWGFAPGVSSFRWEPGIAGAPGAEGATLRVNIVGGNGRTGDGIDASITLAGMTVEQARALPMATGVQPAGSYLYIHAP